MKVEFEFSEAVISAIAEQVVTRLQRILPSAPANAPVPVPGKSKPTEGKNLINEKEVSLRTGLAVGSLRNMRCQGKGPPFYRVNGRTIRYKADELTDWMEQFKVNVQR